TMTFLDSGSITLGTANLNAAGTATLATNALAVALHNITALYSGNANFNTSSSLVLAETVNKANTTSALVSGANPAVFGQSVTFTITVAVAAPGTGVPDGSVAILDGGLPIATVTLDNTTSQATFTTGSLAVGAHSLTARYLGNASLNLSTSAAVTETINKAGTTTAVTTSGTPAAVGTTVTFTATVTPTAPGTGTRTGTVNFLDGAATIGSATVNTGGVASVST